MARSSKKFKNRKSSKERFFGIPRSVLDHPDFINLSLIAIKLLIDVGMQYNGFNNGDLCAAMSLMKKRGWNSCDTLDKAKKELVEKRIIILTRQGGRRRANLYALAWHSIDDCKGKLDIPSTNKPPRNFCFE